MAHLSGGPELHHARGRQPARTRQAQTELAAAEAILSSSSTSPLPLTLDEVVNTLRAVRALPDLLTDADPQIRHEIYKSLGVTLRYRREGSRELVKVDSALQSVDLNRVGGGA